MAGRTPEEAMAELVRETEQLGLYSDEFVRLTEAFRG